MLRINPVLPGVRPVLLLATRIIHGRFYLFLLHISQGALRQLFPIYLSNLTSFIMLSFNLFLVPFSFISSLDLLMRLTPTTNQLNMVQRWRSYVLLSVVGHGYIRQLLRELLLIISGKYFFIGLIDINMTNKLVSKNYQNDLLQIS